MKPLILLLLISPNLNAADACSVPIEQNSHYQLIKKNLGSQKRQSKFYILPQEIDKTALLIDVRDHKAYQQVHILGSLNIPAYSLKTKTFLKNKHLILIGQNYQMLEKLYQSLQKAGFKKLSILDGGFKALPLIGDVRKLETSRPIFKKVSEP